MAAIGARIEPITSVNDRGALLLITVGATAMALQNAVMVAVLRLHPPTTVMTGNLTRLMLRLVEPSAGKDTHPERQSAPRAWRKGVWTNVAVLVIFAVGALAGAYGFAGCGFRVLAVPAVLVALASANAFLRAGLPR